MKKIICYLLLITLFYNYYLPIKNINVVDILFFNKSYYEQISLNYHDIALIIAYLFFQILILYYFLYDIKEISSYYNMQRYRQTKKSFFINIIGINLIKGIKLFVVLMAFITIYQATTKSSISLVTYFIYLIKIIIIYISLGIIETFKVLKDKENTSLVINYLIIIFLVFTDLTINTKFLTFSGTPLVETKYLLTLISIILIFWLLFIFIKRIEVLK
mgnify:FL=1